MPSNDCIAATLVPSDLFVIEHDVEAAAVALLDALRIPWRDDHNTKDTPRRYARMLVREACAGRFTAPPTLTEFPNVANLDQLYVVGPLAVRSVCAHHLTAITGRAWIGVLPSARILGLSKFARVVAHVMARPQIQEEATVQIADAIEEAIKPLGLAVIVRAQHLCMTWRGVRDTDAEMTTSVMRGLLLDKPAARSEFLQLVHIGGDR